MLSDSLGIPAKLDTHGDDVGKLYDEGKIEAIEEYCSQDVASTLMLWANCRAMEIGDAAYHASLIYQFSRWAGMQGADHLAPFAEVEDLQDLLRQSLVGQIDAALENAQFDADLRAKKALDASFTQTMTY